MTTVIAISATGCGHWVDNSGNTTNNNEDEIVRIGCLEGCTCTGCICCGTLQPGDLVLETSPESTETLPTQTEPSEESAVPQTETTQTPPETSTDNTPQETETSSESLEMVTDFSEGELAARREQQANFAAARETLYSLENSKDKTTKINQMDRQILDNNAFDFRTKNIVFIGDSITEGITSAVDENGNFVSYVTYANAYLHFNTLLNHGKGGRMFAQYGGDDLSLASNFSNVTNVNSDIIVVFAGVNDYLSVVPDKRFGNIDDKVSTAGYCGAVRYFMKQLKQYYGDNEIFFVTMYDIAKTSECTYSDFAGKPTLNDFLEVQRKLAAEYGFHIIELYDIGFMDCTSQEASDYYLRDGIHPKDNGNIVLGEHIAAELSLYFGQKQNN